MACFRGLYRIRKLVVLRFGWPFFAQVDVEEVQNAQRQATVKVQEAVQSALGYAGAADKGKRKATPAKAESQEAFKKKPKMLACLVAVSDDDEDDDDDDDA